MKQRISESFNSNNNLKEKINVLFSLLFLNISYIILEMPLSIIDFKLILQGDLFYYFLYLGNFGYAFNFYIIVISNSLFHKEFMSFLMLK